MRGDLSFAQKVHASFVDRGLLPHVRMEHAAQSAKHAQELLKKAQGCVVEKGDGHEH